MSRLAAPRAGLASVASLRDISAKYQPTIRSLTARVLTGMQVKIVSYEDSHVDAVRQFNERLKAGGLDMKFPESPVPAWLPPSSDREIFQEYFLAQDGDGAVRGGYFLKHQSFSVRGRKMSVGVFQLMISEGVVNPAYSMVGILMLRDVLKRQPFLYALGMGGLDHPLSKMFHTMGWKLSYVPFYFKVRNPRRFLKNIRVLRRSTFSRAVLDVLATSGVGTVPLRSIHGLVGMRALLGHRVEYELIPSFDGWADRLWEEASKEYSMAAIRDARTLNILYPEGKPFHRILVKVNGVAVGWSVVLATSMTGHNYFGNMRVGSIVDCVARSGNERPVILASAQYLDQQRVDVIVSNLNHAAWRDGARYAGFLRGPSNYVFGVSLALEELLKPVEQALSSIHVTRGDGDGPINL